MSRKRQIVASAVNLADGAAAADRLRVLAGQQRRGAGERGGEAKAWYRVVARDALTTEIMIYDEISDWGVTAYDFVSELRGIVTPNVTVRINSPGGSIFDGFAIYNALLSHPARVKTQIDGIAASAASFIAQAGDEIVAAEASTMMVHGGSGLCWGKAADMREMADLLDKLDGQMAQIYAQRTERPVDEWLAQMPLDTWYTSSEALVAGLVDRVEAPRAGDTEPADTPAEDDADATAAALLEVFGPTVSAGAADDLSVLLRSFREE